MWNLIESREKTGRNGQFLSLPGSIVGQKRGLWKASEWTKLHARQVVDCRAMFDFYWGGQPAENLPEGIMA